MYKAVREEIMDKTKVMSHASAFSAVMIWGITFIATKQLLKTFTMSEILVVRFIMGVITLHILDAGRKKPRFAWKDELLFALCGASGVTLYYGMETLSLTMTSASNVGILTSLAPLTTAIAGAFFLKSERLRPSYIWGSLLAFAGVVLVILNGTRFEGFSLRGDLIALSGTMAWATYSLLLKRIETEKYHLITYTRKLITYGLLFIFPSIFLDGSSLQAGNFTALNLGLLLFLGILASAFCFVFWNFSVAHIGVYATSIYIYTMPLVTLFAAALFLGEPVTLQALIGTVTIIGGLYIGERAPLGKSRQVQEESA